VSATYIDRAGSGSLDCRHSAWADHQTGPEVVSFSGTFQIHHVVVVAVAVAQRQSGQGKQGVAFKYSLLGWQVSA
jgi:hypothetical protein